MLLRLAWALVCVVVWPVYYLWLGARWMIPYPLRPLQRVWEADDRLLKSFRSPPYLDRLRG